MRDSIALDHGAHMHLQALAFLCCIGSLTPYGVNASIFARALSPGARLQLSKSVRCVLYNGDAIEQVAGWSICSGRIWLCICPFPQRIPAQ